jgi:hypothetical protein
MRSIQFAIQGRHFQLESDGNGNRRVIDRNNVEWSDQELIELAGETEATTALAYALRDLERFTQYRVPDER